MARNIVFGVKVEDQDANKSIKELKDEIKATSKEADKLGEGLEESAKDLGKSALTVKERLTTIEDSLRNVNKKEATQKAQEGFLALNKLVRENALGFQELGPAIDSYKNIAQAAGVESPVGKKAIERAAQLTDQAADLNARINILASDTKALDAAMGVGTGVAAGFQAAQGAAALFGSESEEVNKAIQKVIAVQGVMNGVQQLSNVLQQESALGQLLQTKRLIAWMKATKVATVVQKAFNFVLRANPLGILITVITAVIGGLIALGSNVKAVGNFFKELAMAILLPHIRILEFFGILKKGTAEDMKQANEAQKQRREQSKEIFKQHKARLKQIEKERKVNRIRHKERQDQFDLDIARLEAEGKSSAELTEQKLKDILEQKRVNLESIKEQFDSWRIYYEQLFLLSGRNLEDFKKVMRGRGVDLERFLRLEQKVIKKANDQIFSAETDLIKHRTDVRKADGEKEVKERVGEMERMEMTRTELGERSIASLQERNINEQEMRAHAQQLELEAEQAHQQKLDSERKFRHEKQLDRIDELSSTANDVIGIADNLNTIFHGKELQRIKEKRDAGEKLTKNEIKRLKQEDRIRKIAAVAQIVSDTARGISGAIAAGSGVLFPGNLVAIASGIGSVLSGIAQAKQALGEQVDLGGVGNIDQSAASGVIEENRQPQINNSNDFGSSLLNQTQRVFVVESDITDVQGKVNVLEQQSTFG